MDGRLAGADIHAGLRISTEARPAAVEAVRMLEKEKHDTTTAQARQIPGWSLHSHMLNNAERNGISAETVASSTIASALADIGTTPGDRRPR